MRIIFLGDVVGRAGREAVFSSLPFLKDKLSPDIIMVNAENASHGFGLSPSIATALFDAGVTVITLGNHSWDRRDLISHIEKEPRIVRPLNYPPGTPGAGFFLYQFVDGRKFLAINVMGRLFMDAMDDPFRLTAELLQKYRLGVTVQAILVDIHAEATSEKWSFGVTFDGKVSAVIGTHTHTPTSDHRILPGGTAFQSDAGMCGDYDSVIGMEKISAASRFVKKMPGERFRPAEGVGSLCGVFIMTNDQTGLAEKIAPIRMGGLLSQTMPDF
ncbi:TIGR00282 family metallophosphoesterase [Entomobacter blattae]|uniref:2',3'-cyclic-nucleotide 2'-phosphodiesterase n=1 Tax=Entomobacter blattae TaxID=2762277 RepID=A0A7H1NTA8_9PROT|nr:TIGR00282 family metallophosphoesterase [Entomobacter blattae]QNT79018.1 2',3'-cyclic-nucleotide 2'-phosphodiesterase [Entomobacter blattae]